MGLHGCVAFTLLEVVLSTVSQQSSDSASPRLKIDKLQKAFGVKQVLTDLSLTVQAGEIYGFVGSNGAGKSTTMRIILGVLAADSGSVLFNSQPVNDDSRRRIGYMPEDRGLYSREKIIDQLVFLSELYGVPRHSALKYSEELLQRLGLGERMEDKLDALSLGNQQRVQLAVALVHNPDLLVLDEPFSGLDPIAVQTMCDILKEKANMGVAVLFSSHQLDLVQRISDRVGILAGGRIAAEGTVHDLRSQGPTRYRIETSARGWYPADSHVVEESPEGVTLELSDPSQEQVLLHAALSAGEVHGFHRVVPDLSELFRTYVS